MRSGCASGRGKRIAGHAIALACASALASLAVAGRADAESLGVDTSKMPNGPVDCSGVGCHSLASASVFVVITGPAELLPGETADYRIEMFENVPGGRQLGAGVNVVAIVDGILTDLEDGILREDHEASQITTATGFPPFVATGQLTHLAAPILAVGKYSYDFTVTAPLEPGTLELRGAMNAFNGSTSPEGDNWSGASLFVAVPEPGAPALGAAALAAVALAGRRVRGRPATWRTLRVRWRRPPTQGGAAC